MAYTWDNAKQNLSIVQLPDGSTRYIKDAEARAAIDTLSSYTKFLGVTTTTITEETGAVVVIDGEDVTAKTGDIVINGAKEYIFNGTIWAEFGDLDAITDLLGDLAYNNSASASYTPSGDIVVTGSFTGKEKTVTVTGSTTGTLTITSSSVTGNYTPYGRINPDVKTTDTTVVATYTSGELPTFTASLLTTSVSGETLTFTLVPNGFDPGTPATVNSTSVINSVTASNPTFTGTVANFEFTPATITLSGSYTPELSTVPTYSFAGTPSTITVTGSQSKPTN